MQKEYIIEYNSMIDGTCGHCSSLAIVQSTFTSAGHLLISSLSTLISCYPVYICHLVSLMCF